MHSKLKLLTLFLSALLLTSCSENPTSITGPEVTKNVTLAKNNINTPTSNCALYPLYDYDGITSGLNMESYRDLKLSATRFVPISSETGNYVVSVGLQTIIHLPKAARSISIFTYKDIQLSQVPTNFDALDENGLLIGSGNVNNIIGGGWTKVSFTAPIGKTIFSIKLKSRARRNAGRWKDLEVCYIGLSDLIQNAKNVISQYQNFTDKKVSKAVEKAIKHLDKSLESELWFDANHLTKKGNKVFDETKQAVKELEDKKFTFPFTDDALIAINFIIDVDRTLAEVSINDAVNANGKQNEIDRANEEMSKATNELNQNDYDKAIDHFKKAWEHSQKASK